MRIVLFLALFSLCSPPLSFASAPFNEGLVQFYENTGKNISFVCSDYEVLGAKHIIYYGLSRLTSINPIFTSHIEKQLKDTRIIIHCKPDPTASAGMVAINSAAVALTRRELGKNETYIYTGRNAFGESLGLLGELIEKQLSSDKNSEYMADPLISNGIVWNALAVIPTLFFHEFLHAVSLDNQTSKKHNTKGILEKDLVYACATGIYGYGKELGFLQEKSKLGCQICSNATYKPKKRSGELLYFQIPKSHKPLGAKETFCANHSEDVLLNILNLASDGRL